MASSPIGQNTSNILLQITTAVDPDTKKVLDSLTNAVLRLDNEVKQFRGGVENLVKSFQKTRQQATALERTFKAIIASVKKVADVFKTASRAAQAFGRYATRLPKESIALFGTALRTVGIFTVALNNALSLIRKVSEPIQKALVQPFIQLSNAIVTAGDKARRFETILRGTTGSIQRSRQLSRLSVQFAQQSPFNQEDVEQAIQSFTILPATAERLANVDFSKTTAELKDLLNTIQGLGLLNPQGVQGALIAFREGLGGNLQSFRRRIDVPISVLSAVSGRQESRIRAGGEDFAAATQAFVEKTLGPGTIQALSRTFEVQKQNLIIALQNVFREIGRAGIYDILVENAQRAADFIASNTFFTDQRTGQIQTRPEAQEAFQAVSDAMIDSLSTLLASGRFLVGETQTRGLSEERLAAFQENAVAASLVVVAEVLRSINDSVSKRLPKVFNDIVSSVDAVQASLTKIEKIADTIKDSIALYINIFILRWSVYLATFNTLINLTELMVANFQNADAQRRQEGAGQLRERFTQQESFQTAKLFTELNLVADAKEFGERLKTLPDDIKTALVTNFVRSPEFKANNLGLVEQFVPFGQTLDEVRRSGNVSPFTANAVAKRLQSERFGQLAPDVVAKSLSKSDVDGILLDAVKQDIDFFVAQLFSTVVEGTGASLKRLTPDQRLASSIKTTIETFLQANLGNLLVGESQTSANVRGAAREKIDEQFGVTRDFVDPRSLTRGSRVFGGRGLRLDENNRAVASSLFPELFTPGADLSRGFASFSRNKDFNTLIGSLEELEGKTRQDRQDLIRESEDKLSKLIAEFNRDAGNVIEQGKIVVSGVEDVTKGLSDTTKAINEFLNGTPTQALAKTNDAVFRAVGFSEVGNPNERLLQQFREELNRSQQAFLQKNQARDSLLSLFQEQGGIAEFKTRNTQLTGGGVQLGEFNEAIQQLRRGPFGTGEDDANRISGAINKQFLAVIQALEKLDEITPRVESAIRNGNTGVGLAAQILFGESATAGNFDELTRLSELLGEEFDNLLNQDLLQVIEANAKAFTARLNDLTQVQDAAALFISDKLLGQFAKIPDEEKSKFAGVFRKQLEDYLEPAIEEASRTGAAFSFRLADELSKSVLGEQFNRQLSRISQRSSTRSGVLSAAGIGAGGLFGTDARSEGLDQQISAIQTAKSSLEGLFAVFSVDGPAAERSLARLDQQIENLVGQKRTLQYQQAATAIREVFETAQREQTQSQTARSSQIGILGGFGGGELSGVATEVQNIREQLGLLQSRKAAEFFLLLAAGSTDTTNGLRKTNEEIAALQARLQQLVSDTEAREFIRTLTRGREDEALAQQERGGLLGSLRSAGELLAINEQIRTSDERILRTQNEIAAIRSRVADEEKSAAVEGLERDLRREQSQRRVLDFQKASLAIQREFADTQRRLDQRQSGDLDIVKTIGGFGGGSLVGVNTQLSQIGEKLQLLRGRQAAETTFALLAGFKDTSEAVRNTTLEIEELENRLAQLGRSAEAQRFVQSLQEASENLSVNQSLRSGLISSLNSSGQLLSVNEQIAQSQERIQLIQAQIFAVSAVASGQETQASTRKLQNLLRQEENQKRVLEFQRENIDLAQRFEDIQRRQQSTQALEASRLDAIESFGGGTGLLSIQKQIEGVEQQILTTSQRALEEFMMLLKTGSSDAENGLRSTRVQLDELANRLRQLGSDKDIKEFFNRLNQEDFGLQVRQDTRRSRLGVLSRGIDDSIRLSNELLDVRENTARLEEKIAALREKGDSQSNLLTQELVNRKRLLGIQKESLEVQIQLARVREGFERERRLTGALRGAQDTVNGSLPQSLIPEDFSRKQEISRLSEDFKSLNAELRASEKTLRESGYTYEQIADETRGLREEIGLLEISLTAQQKALDNFNNLGLRLADSLTSTFKNEFSSGLSSALLDFFRGTKTFEEAMVDFGIRLGESLIQSFIQTLIQRLIVEKAIEGIFAALSAGNSLGSFAGPQAAGLAQGGGGIIGSVIGRQMGGIVGQNGPTISRLGENGPEVVAPLMAGNRVPLTMDADGISLMLPGGRKVPTSLMSRPGTGELGASAGAVGGRSGGVAAPPSITIVNTINPEGVVSAGMKNNPNVIMNPILDNIRGRGSIVKALSGVNNRR